MQDDDLNIEKLYYSIGEVAAMFQVNASLLRFWEKEFTILNPRKNTKGDRHYTQKDIESFRVIYQLVKEKGFTLNGAKQYLKGHKKAEIAAETTDSSVQIKESLQSLKQFLQEIKNKI
ncbi:MAG: MerR family transcriptional regulator [Bacteroidetes bacterium]|jgi:DNA-binding transcriptional MerR regulator|nr:MerR family transcriptional regulator [Bacteroidota bacterium]